MLRRGKMTVVALIARVGLFGCLATSAPAGWGASGAGHKPPYNVIFVICDQESYRLFGKNDFHLPARETLAKRGVTFKNHYISTAVCTPSRALFLTGTPPQVNGVFDQMSFRYVPNLPPKVPTMGTVLKELGYKTAYFGKFECNLDILSAKKTDNTSAAMQPYGFDVYNPDGDNRGGPLDGYIGDSYCAGEGVRWLRGNTPGLRKQARPFFMVTSFVNPHDIMFVDANVPGKSPVQKALAPGLLSPRPPSAMYERQWEFSLPLSLQESFKAPGMPAALGEYDRGWAGLFGVIPTDRKDMWRNYYNYYLNCLRDSDRSIQQLVDVMDDLDLWKDTVVVFSADHGEMAGAHGGLRGKGPMCYEANVHVPLIIAHPDGKAGTSCSALTCHLDLLPSFVGLTGIPEGRRPQAVKKLAGRDFSPLLADPEKADIHALRLAILFNYVGLSTVDADYLVPMFIRGFGRKAPPPLTDIKLDKRGFLGLVFDGRDKLARFYAPNDFNTPKTPDQLFKHNDVQVFDLKKNTRS